LQEESYGLPKREDLLQKLTRRARNLGDAQARKIGGDLTDQFEIGGGKLATGKGLKPDCARP